MKNVKKQINIKLATTERRRNYLVTEPNYHSKKFFISNRNQRNSNINE